jgi:gamma-glutamyltranspeptidase/glutathione hydrolase
MYIRSDGTLDTEGPTIGYRSVAIPASVAGFDLALRAYGTMKLADVMAPAIRLAEEGFPVSEKLARSLRASRPNLQRFSVSRRIFLKDGALYQPGENFRQPELAETLRRIARGGAAEFYRGKLAHEIADEITRMGGLISDQDLAGFQAKLREPLRAKYKMNGAGWEVISSPPPSSGGVAAIEALNILDGVDLGRSDSLESIHWIAETMRRVFADRSAYLADPDFAHVPVRGLTDPRYAAELRAGIGQRSAPSRKSRAIRRLIRLRRAESARAAVHPRGRTHHALLRRGRRGQRRRQHLHHQQQLRQRRRRLRRIPPQRHHGRFHHPARRAQ